MHQHSTLIVPVQYVACAFHSICWLYNIHSHIYMQMCVCGYIFVTITNAGSKAAKVSTCMKVQNTLRIVSSILNLEMLNLFNTLHVALISFHDVLAICVCLMYCSQTQLCCFFYLAEFKTIGVHKIKFSGCDCCEQSLLGVHCLMVYNDRLLLEDLNAVILPCIICQKCVM